MAGMLGVGRAHGAGSLAQTAALPSPSLLDLASESDAILGFEVRKGCLGEVEAQLDAIRKKILEWQTGYTGTVYEDEALDRIWVNLLRLGLFEELRHLAGPCNLPFRFEDSEDLAQFGATHAKLLGQVAFGWQSRICTEANGTEPMPNC